MNLELLLPLIIVSSLALSFAVRWYAVRANVVDIPDHRSSHTIATPRGGGLAIVISALFACSYLAWQQQLDHRYTLALCLPGALVGLVSFVDDHSHLPKSLRLALHIASVMLLLYLLPELPQLALGPYELDLGDPLVLPFLTISLVWLINLSNFMDGIDGIASTQAIAALLGMNLIGSWGSGSVEPFSLIVSASVAGFLCLNWAPAKLFMGDIGSCFLGLLVPAIGLYMAVEYQISYWSCLILLAVFITDASWTLIVRFSSGQRWSEPHRSHAYQILSRKWHSHARVVCAMLAIITLWLMPLAVLATQYSSLGVVFFALACAPLVTICHGIGAGQETTL